MSNKYEREIEEILRNLEKTEPKPSIGQKISGRLRRKSEVRYRTRRRAMPALNFSASEWLLIIAWLAALLAGGWAFAQGAADLFTGTVAVIGAVCLLVMLILPFVGRSNYAARPGPYGNVTAIRRNPLSSLATRWNLFVLKLRYRRRKDH
jgi:ABC-type multidrug transport system fused ATPase/permease subunit